MDQIVEAYGDENVNRSQRSGSKPGGSPLDLRSTLSQNPAATRDLELAVSRLADLLKSRSLSDEVVQSESDHITDEIIHKITAQMNSVAGVKPVAAPVSGGSTTPRRASEVQPKIIPQQAYFSRPYFDDGDAPHVTHTPRSAQHPAGRSVAARAGSADGAATGSAGRVSMDRLLQQLLAMPCVV
jgi:hypothetical protein